MYLATALAQQGEIADSAKALSRADSRHGTKSALFAPELGVARAWRLATVGDGTHAAIDAAREAARGAERSGQLGVAVWAWNEAARLGDAQAAGAIAKLAETVDARSPGDQHVISPVRPGDGRLVAADENVVEQAGLQIRLGACGSREVLAGDDVVEKLVHEFRPRTGIFVVQRLPAVRGEPERRLAGDRAGSSRVRATICAATTKPVLGKML